MCADRRRGTLRGVAEIQERLIAVGLSSGTPDGVLGEATETAIATFQQMYGLEATADKKQACREATVEVLKNWDFRGKERMVRINKFGSEYFEEDLAAILPCKPRHEHGNGQNRQYAQQRGGWPDAPAKKAGANGQIPGPARAGGLCDYFCGWHHQWHPCAGDLHDLRFPGRFRHSAASVRLSNNSPDSAL